jgi:hypothetical protein
MPSWNEITQKPEFQSLPLREQQIKKMQFWNDTIKNSPKFKSLDIDKQNKVYEDMFPNNEYSKIAIRESVSGLWNEWKNAPVIKQSGDVIEKVAKVVEPKVPAGRTTLGLMTKDLPRQVVADVLRAYKPETLLPFLGATKVLKPVLAPVGKTLLKAVPEKAREVLLRNFTIGKGQPAEYQSLAKEARLSRASGVREAEDVAQKLSIAPEDISGVTKEGIKFTVKKGQPIPLEYQRYVGRIFRKEVDIGGKKAFISPEESTKLAKNVEVEVAFNPEVQSLQRDLGAVNKSLRSKETLAKGLVGKKFRTGTGFIEEATGVSKVPKVKPSGLPSKKRFGIELVSEPIVPKPPTVSPIPSKLLKEEEQIGRSLRQVSKAPSIEKFQNLPRQELLQQRKSLSRQLQSKVKDIEIGVRSNYQVFDRTFSEQIRTHPKYQQLSKIADEGRSVMDKWSNELAKSGIPKEQSRKVIEENIGSYMARMYKSKMKPKTTGFGMFKDLRLRLNGIKHRKELSGEILNLMGEIKEPALPTAIRVKEISTSIANNKLFSKVAQNPEWVADTNIGGKLIKMPDTPSVGALKGKWVIPEIAEDINAITKVGEQAQSMYAKALSAWKFMKVPMNPATQVRNMITNTMLLDMSGTSHIRQLQLFPKAFKELLTNGKLYKQALEDGAVGGEFVGTETMKKLHTFYMNTPGNNLQKWMNIAKMPFQKAGELYQGMEQLAKMVKYSDVLARGGTRQKAAQEAQKWLFNYQEVPKVIDWAKKSPFGAPFITFTYKALPRVAETIVNRPMALYKYYALFNGFNEASRKMQGMSPEEYARQKKALPSWVMKDIGGVPTNLLLPLKDKYGRTQWLNLEYILPFGQAPEIMEKGILKGGLSNPVFNLLKDITTNSDFSGKPIYPPESTSMEAAHAIISHIYKQVAPSLAPSIPVLTEGGYSFEKIMDAVLKRPDYADRTRDLTPTLFDTLAGFKINSLDVGEAEQFKMWDKKKRIDELRKQYLKLNHPKISEKKRDTQSEVIFKKIQGILEE